MGGLIAVVAGLALFMVVASPSDRARGRRTPPTGSSPACLSARRWRFWSGTGCGRPVGPKATVLGVAAGLSDAFMAVLTKAFAHVTDQGVVSALTSWAPYALCAAGLTAMLLTQTAYQAGLPKVSLPIITVADPLVSCGIGVALFGEALKFTGARAPFVVVAIAIMATGLIVLSRSEAAAEAPEPAVSR